MLWSATRMTERYWLITGEDLLGMPKMTENIGPYRFNPYIEAGVPVTPFMDTQLDEIAIKDILLPLKNRLLRRFKKKVLEKKKENWYELFLATFIMLHDLEVVLEEVKVWSDGFGLSVSKHMTNSLTIFPNRY